MSLEPGRWVGPVPTLAQPLCPGWGTRASFPPGLHTYPACLSVQQWWAALSSLRAASSHAGCHRMPWAWAPGRAGQLGSAIVWGDHHGRWGKGYSLGFRCRGLQNRQMAFWPLAHELHAQGSGGSWVARCSGLMRIPERPHLLTRHWNPSTPSYLPGQTPSLTTTVLT